MRLPNAFVLMPSSSAYEPVKQIVLDVLHELDVEIYCLEDDVQIGARWANEITHAIVQADLVVADVSDQNSTVMYELGYAHAVRKQTILLLSTEYSGNIPFDLTSYQILTYYPQKLDELRRQLHRVASYALKRADAMA